MNFLCDFLHAIYSESLFHPCPSPRQYLCCVRCKGHFPHWVRKESKELNSGCSMFFWRQITSSLKTYNLCKYLGYKYYSYTYLATNNQAMEILPLVIHRYTVESNNGANFHANSYLCKYSV